MTPCIIRFAGFQLCCQHCTARSQLLADFFQFGVMAESSLACLFHGVLLEVGARAEWLRRVLGKRVQESIHGVRQVLPGDFDGFLESRQLPFVRIFEILDPALELGKQVRTYSSSQ
jgi:hypothetical protein